MKKLILILCMLPTCSHAGFGSGFLIGSLFGGGSKTMVIQPLPLQNASEMMDGLLRAVIKKDMDDNGLTHPEQTYSFYMNSSHKETLVQDNAEEQQALVMSKVKRLTGWDRETKQMVFEYKTMYVIMATNAQEHYEVEAVLEAEDMKKCIIRRGFKISLKGVI